MFGLSESEIRAKLNPKDYIGRSAEQVDDFLANEVKPAIANYLDEVDFAADLKV